MRTKIRIAAAALALAYVGYSQWRAHHAPPASTSAAATATSPAKAAPPAPPLMFGKIAFHPCTLSAPLVHDGVEAQCGSLSVPENSAQPTGRRIDLNIAWVQANDSSDAASDAVFFLAGGPGQAAVATFPQVAPAFQRVLQKRNVILVDQRGTGKSNLLACDLGDDDADSAEADAPVKVESATRGCVDALAKKADLTQYGTTQAVADLDAVREALGIAKVDLVGVSYGTRVAQQYAMRHPDRTRAVVLDSVVPNTLYLGNIWARNLDDALALQFGVCSRDAKCAATLGDPRKELQSLMATLRAKPPMVTYADPATGVQKTAPLTPADVAGLVRMFAYMPVMSSLLPLQIHEANQGRYATLKSMADLLHASMKDAMAMGMQMSVICAEDGDHMTQSAPGNDGTLLGNGLTDAMARMCSVWPKGAVPADFHAALATRVPTLVLEGEFDPVTPPRYGEEVVKTLPAGRLLVLKGQGHNVIGVGCMPKLFASFIETADAKALDAKCLDTLGYTPPFTSFTGWTP